MTMKLSIHDFNKMLKKDLKKRKSNKKLVDIPKSAFIVKVSQTI